MTKIHSLVTMTILACVCLADEPRSLLEISSAYTYRDAEHSRNLRSEVWKWDFHFASEIQKSDKAMSLAFDGANLHANTSHESLLYFNHRVHTLAYFVTNDAMALEFTNIVERWITNLPSGPE